MDNPASLKLKAPCRRKGAARAGGADRRRHRRRLPAQLARQTEEVRGHRRQVGARGRDHRYFGLVQTHDDKPERRLFEVLRDQDLRINQGLTFLTDGGDSVRAFLDGISLGAENYLDWFRAT